MLRKLIPFLSVCLLAGAAFAGSAPASAHDSYASQMGTSDTGQHPRHHRRHHRHRHRHLASSRSE